MKLLLLCGILICLVIASYWWFLARMAAFADEQERKFHIYNESQKK